MRHEADVLAVGLVGDSEPELARDAAHLLLGHVAERKAQEVELRLRGGEEEVALVAVEIDAADKAPAARRRRASAHSALSPSLGIELRAVSSRSANLTVWLQETQGIGVSPRA